MRIIKVKTRVTGCFRTEEGDKSFMTMISYISMTQKHNIGSMKAITKALINEGDFIFV